jgi:Tat protein secretion system quality control protein TatD with DNase activity
MGFYLGFGLQITNQQSKRLRDIVKNLPIESLLIETDDPSVDLTAWMIIGKSYFCASSN